MVSTARALSLLSLGWCLAGCGSEADAPVQPAEPGPARSAPAASADSPTSPPRPFEGRLELATKGLPEGLTARPMGTNRPAELWAATRSPGSLHVWRHPLGAPEVLPIDDYPLGPFLLGSLDDATIAVLPRSQPALWLVNPQASPPAVREKLPLPEVPRAAARGSWVEEEALAIATRMGGLWIFASGELRRVADLQDELPTCLALVPGLIVVGSQATETLRAYREAEGGELLPCQAIDLGGIPRDLRWDPETRMLSVALGDHHLHRYSLEELRSGQGQGRRESVLPSVPIALAKEGPHEVLLGNGSLTFASGDQHAYAGQDAWDAALADFDGDGHTDLAIANRGASRVSWLPGGPKGFDAGHFLEVGRGPHSVAAADLDGDGVPELLSLEAMANSVSLLKQDEVGDYQRVQSLTATPAADRLDCADVDGDGHVDVAYLVRDDAGTRLRILWGRSTAELPEVHDEFPVGRGGGDLLWKDLDRDGQPEAVIADPEDGSVHVLMHGGARQLREVARLAVPSAPVALASGPGSTVAVGLGEPGPRLGYAWLLAKGSGAQLSLEEVAYVPSPHYAIDLAVLEDSVALLGQPDRGDGPGRLVLHEIASGEVQHTAVTGQRSYALTAGDIDGDGRADLCVGAQNNHHVNAWLRNSDGSLKRLPDLGVGRGVLDVLLVDVNGDGRADAVAANSFSNDVCVRRSAYR